MIKILIKEILYLGLQGLPLVSPPVQWTLSSTVGAFVWLWYLLVQPTPPTRVSGSQVGVGFMNCDARCCSRNLRADGLPGVSAGLAPLWIIIIRLSTLPVSFCREDEWGA